MRNISGLVLSLTISACAQKGTSYPEDSTSADGTMSYHGLRIDESNAIAVTELTELVDKSGAVDKVKINGKIEECCKVKGCWMTMKLADGSDMRITFKDYGFFVPKDIDGKESILKV